MDADWGSSSDEEDAAERAQRDAEKLKETMALLEAFERTREPVKADYGSTGEQFRHERAQAAGRAQWEVCLAFSRSYWTGSRLVMKSAVVHKCRCLSTGEAEQGRRRERGGEGDKRSHEIPHHSWLHHHLWYVTHTRIHARIARLA